MEVYYKGKILITRKELFYCKAGAYEHKWRTGWVLVDGMTIVKGNKLVPNGPFGAYRHDYPEYRTRKDLLKSITEEEGC